MLTGLVEGIELTDKIMMQVGGAGGRCGWVVRVDGAGGWCAWVVRVMHVRSARGCCNCIKHLVCMGCSISHKHCACLHSSAHNTGCPRYCTPHPCRSLAKMVWSVCSVSWVTSLIPTCTTQCLSCQTLAKIRGQWPMLSRYNCVVGSCILGGAWCFCSIVGVLGACWYNFSKHVAASCSLVSHVFVSLCCTQTGYLLHGRVVRPASVGVVRAP